MGRLTGEVDPGELGSEGLAVTSQRAVGQLGRLTGEDDPGELGSEGLAAPSQLGWVPGKVEPRALVSEGGLGVGREDEKQGLDSVCFQGLPGGSWTGLVSGSVDLGVTLGSLGQSPWKEARCQMRDLGEGWD